MNLSASIACPIVITRLLLIGHDPLVEDRIPETQKEAKIKYFDLKVCAYHKYCFLLRSQINGERIAAWTSVMWKNTEVYLPRIMIGKAIFKRLAIFEMCRPETQLVLWTLTVGLD